MYLQKSINDKNKCTELLRHIMTTTKYMNYIKTYLLSNFCNVSVIAVVLVSSLPINSDLCLRADSHSCNIIKVINNKTQKNNSRKIFRTKYL